MKGRLILFPGPIGAEDIAASLPSANKELLASCHTFIVEELRTARRFLKKAGYPFAIDDISHLFQRESILVNLTRLKSRAS